MLFSPPDVSPLEYKGVRYQQDCETDFVEREYAATYLSATDVETEKLLWLVKVRDCIMPPDDDPSDVGYIDINKMTVGPSEDELTIETVVGSRHLIDLKTRTAKLVFSPNWNLKRPVYPSVTEPQPPMPPTRPRLRKK